MLFVFNCRVVELFHPKHPHEEDDEVEEHLEDIVVGEMECVDVVAEDVDMDAGPEDLHQ